MTKTALITGASSGIGAVFAQRLAADGYGLILVARRESKLAALAAELRDAHSIDAATLKADLSNPGDLARVITAINQLPQLDLLINNAGFGTQGTFAEGDITSQLDMVTVHIDATMRLSRAALPEMMARRSGAIINVSSVAGFIPLSGNATYASTKAFLNAFSQALQLEVQDYGVRIQALCPGFTHTEFHDPEKYGEFDRSVIPKWLWMGAEQVVDTSLAALRTSKVIVIPGFKNRVLVTIGGSRALRPVIRALRRRLMFRSRPRE